MRVLVTGHLGYIGSVLVPLLVERGDDVVGLDSGFFSPCLLPGQPAPPEVPNLATDMRGFDGDLGGFDAVVHLAALSNDPLGNLDAELTYDINQHASAALATRAKAAGVRRFVFASSCSTYGAAGDAILDESAAFNPVTPYGWSKVHLERHLLELADDHFSPVLLRNATAYGLSPRPRLDVVLNNLVAWAVTSGRIHLLSDGTPWRPIVHVEDICSAILAGLDAPRAAVHAQAFNIGRSSENYRISELAEIVAETVPGCTITYAEGAGPDTRCYRVSCAKAETSLPGYAPRWDARAGARQLAEAYAAGGLSAEDLSGPRYIRLARIRELQQGGEIDPQLRWV
jgi:nucleoside-diphosphate-sugar epimerase